ncbi:unnamed protein product [Ilex paraguariensis]|uniref:PB1 domain-containing protein n=1 Tax=Ilex paraguariensis TaxID=185542 RepID=A0ABC8R1Z0_9AQUA
MEKYSYNSYPESGDSSPRSREIEFENPTPWEDQHQASNYKVKFMCSYGGKIHPRPHDNQFSYIAGETKILAVDRSIKFSSLISKLSVICDFDNVSFKYQLPGEDLDALISVTSDDDLEHMMLEYDRLYRASPKPARLRLFLFPANPPAVVPQRNQSFDSDEAKSEKERFVEALNSGPIQPTPPLSAVAPPNNVDFFFGLEKGMAAPPPPAVAAKVRDPIPELAVHEPDLPAPCVDPRVIRQDPIQKHIEDLQRLRVSTEEQGMYRRKSDDNLAGGFTGDYYVQKVPEKAAPPNLPVTMPGYWTEKQVAGGVLPSNTWGMEQPVYMIPAPAAGMYQAPPPPMGRPMIGPTGQGYYAVQRMQPDVYRDQQVYNVVQSAPPPVQSAAAPVPATLPAQAPPKVAAYSEGIGMMKPTTTVGVGVSDTGYAQVAYDNGFGRQVFYTQAAGGVMPPAPQYQAMPAAVSAEMRPAGVLNQEGGKVVAAKFSQTTA